MNPATAAGIDRAVEQAKIAQEKWCRTTFEQRRQVLRSILQFVLKHQEEICQIAGIDSGKTMIDAALGEIFVTVEKLEWTIKHGEKALRVSKRPTNILMMHKVNTIQYEPLGVVASLVSWNYPFHNIIGPVISAIFAGNGIVVKASENTAWSAAYFTTIAKGALSVCGHDPNLVQSVTCWPQTAGHLTSHPGISHITFIGSRPVAKKVCASAAQALIPVVVELGGKDAALILDSAVSDIPRLTEILLRGTFQAAGQNCIGIERIVACPAVYEKLVTIFETRIKQIRVGNLLDESSSKNVDMGAMVSAVSFDRLEELIKSAVRDGARLLVGGSRLAHPVYPHGQYFQPTLLVDVTPEMAIAQEECFAPICVLMPAKSTEDAVNIANSSEFGLGAAAFGALGEEMDAVVRSLESGMVAVNDFATFYAAQLPFGGIKGSGYGKFAGDEGLRGLCNAKSISRDRWDWLGVRTPIPKGMRYPIPDTARGYTFTTGLMGFGYGTLRQKVEGIVTLIRNG